MTTFIHYFEGSITQ
jgi:hypothetical protein